jgi:molybdate transport system substrate-binding protein
VKIRLKWVAMICLALLIARPEIANAAELKVLTTGAIKPIIQAMIPHYEQESGNTVALVNDTAGGVVKRVEAGETFDVIVAPPSAIKSMIGKGFILSGTNIDLVKVGIGVAVKEGEPKPDISSVDAFKRALLAAHSVTYIDPASGGSSGIYLANLFKRLGIAAEIKPKSILSNGGLSAMFLVSGQAEIAIQQISELMLVKGVTVVGPLPAAIQNYTIYTGSIGAHSEKKAAASAFLKLLTSPAAVQLLQEKGMQPANP